MPRKKIIITTEQRENIDAEKGRYNSDAIKKRLSVLYYFGEISARDVVFFADIGIPKKIFQSAIRIIDESPELPYASLPFPSDILAQLNKSESLADETKIVQQVWDELGVESPLVQALQKRNEKEIKHAILEGVTDEEKRGLYHQFPKKYAAFIQAEFNKADEAKSPELPANLFDTKVNPEKKITTEAKITEEQMKCLALLLAMGEIEEAEERSVLSELGVTSSILAGAIEKMHEASEDEPFSPEWAIAALDRFHEEYETYRPSEEKIQAFKELLIKEAKRKLEILVERKKDLIEIQKPSSTKNSAEKVAHETPTETHQKTAAHPHHPKTSKKTKKVDEPPKMTESPSMKNISEDIGYNLPSLAELAAKDNDFPVELEDSPSAPLEWTDKDSHSSPLATEPDEHGESEDFDDFEDDLDWNIPPKPPFVKGEEMEPVFDKGGKIDSAFSQEEEMAPIEPLKAREPEKPTEAFNKVASKPLVISVQPNPINATQEKTIQQFKTLVETRLTEAEIDSWDEEMTDDRLAQLMFKVNEALEKADFSKAQLFLEQCGDQHRGVFSELLKQDRAGNELEMPLYLADKRECITMEETAFEHWGIVGLTYFRIADRIVEIKINLLKHQHASETTLNALKDFQHLNKKNAQIFLRNLKARLLNNTENEKVSTQAEAYVVNIAKNVLASALGKVLRTVKEEAFRYLEILKKSELMDVKPFAIAILKQDGTAHINVPLYGLADVSAYENIVAGQALPEWFLEQAPLIFKSHAPQPTNIPSRMGWLMAALDLEKHPLYQRFMAAKQKIR